MREYKTNTVASCKFNHTVFFHVYDYLHLHQGYGRRIFSRVEASSNTRNYAIFKSTIVTQGAFGCQKQRRFGALTSTLFWGRFVHALWPHGGGEIEEKPRCSSRVPRVILAGFLQLFDMFGSCLVFYHVWSLGYGMQNWHSFILRFQSGVL